MFLKDYIKRHKYCICLLSISALLSYTSLAQRYPFYNLNVENGLIQSQATCLTQDSLGNLWIGTVGGISRYDGKNITNYTVRNGLINNIISAIAANKNGDLWIGYPEGLSRFDGKKFSHFTLSGHEKNGTLAVREIKFQGPDTTWCRAGNKVYYIVKNVVGNLRLPDINAHITALLPDGGNLWVAKDDGIIYRYSNNKYDSLRMPMLANPDVHVFIYKLLKGKNEIIWAATNSGVFKIRNNEISIQYHDLPPLLAITEDKNGALWMGTNNGAIYIKGTSVQYFNKRNGLSDNIFNDVLTDKEGNVWLASDGQGIFRYSGSQFTALDETMGLPSAQVMGIASDNTGNLYLGTYDAGLYSFAEGKVQKIDFPSNPIPRITTLCEKYGKLWIGTRGRGLWSYDGSVFNSYASPEYNLPSNIVTSFYGDTSGKLWIGFANGAVIYKNSSFTVLPLNNVRVSDFVAIGSDSVILSTDEGLKLYHAGNISLFKTNSAPDSATPECLTLKGDELWIGTSDKGIIDYNLKTCKSTAINKSNGLFSDFIYTLVSDNENNIWAGTGYGIHKISTRENGKPGIVFYGTGQGIAGMESNHKSILKMHDGSIWFGTTNGALHYLPHSENIVPRPVSIVMQSIKLFGENIADTSYFDSTDNWYGVPYQLRLPYRKNNLTFTFHAISLSAGSQLLYRYELEGLDAPWSAWSANNSVNYSALPPGTYVFRVQCKANGTDQKISELSYSFEIITPFQKTRWFRLIILGACILLGISLQYIVNKRKQRRERLLANLRAEEQAKIRMRTAEDFHDEVGNKITRINVLTNVLKSKVGEVTPEVKRIFSQIEENTGQLYSGTQDILWSLTPSNDSLFEILNRIRDFGNQLFQDTETEFEFEGIDEAWRKYRLPLDMSRNLIMIFKEALNNSLKYSKADKIKLEAEIKKKDILQMVLKDNGAGFDMQTIKKGHGINNMNVRAERLSGRLYIDSKAGKGTLITLTFKIPSKRG